ncbi:MAG: hypothetical protein ACOCYT_05710 [Chloroflexota bacterium]
MMRWILQEVSTRPRHRIVRPSAGLIVFLMTGLLAACAGGDAGNGDVQSTRFVGEAATNAAPATPELTPESGDADAPAVALPATWTSTPTPSATATASITPTISVTPSSTITDTPSPTLTATPSPTLEPAAINSLVQLALSATVLPQTFFAGQATPTPGLVPLPDQPTAAGTTRCQYPPAGRFAQTVAINPGVYDRIGCPVGAPPTITNRGAAFQSFERGTMIWLNDPTPAIYVLFNDGRFQRYQDTYNPSVDPDSGGETPPPGLLEPVRGFGKVWRTIPGVRDSLGWALQPETGDRAALQEFTQGRLLFLPLRGDVLELDHDIDPTGGRWISLPG